MRNFTKRAYEAYFDMKLGDQDKQWTPYKVCKNCTDTLRIWTQGKVNAMRFEVPMVWRSPKNHQERLLFLHGEHVRMEQPHKEFVVLS